MVIYKGFYYKAIPGKFLCFGSKWLLQCVKKVVSDSLGLVDFAIGLVISVINLSDGRVNFFKEFKLQKNCEINLLIKTFCGQVEMIFGLVNVSFSLPEWQAVKMTFFAPCCLWELVTQKKWSHMDVQLYKNFLLRAKD